MENISTSITLQDNVTGPMMNIVNMIDLSVVSIEQLQTVINNSIDVSVYEEVHNQLTQTVTVAQELDDTLQNIAQPEVTVHDEKITQAIGKTDRFTQVVKGLTNEFVTMDTASGILGMADQMATVGAQLDRMNDGMRTTKELQDMVFASAVRTGGSYQATAEAVADMGMMAGSAFSDNGETVAFVEQINKQFALAGMETSEAQSAMQQLTQAMQDGVLSGEEYSGVFGQAPDAIQSIAGYIEGNSDVLNAVASAMGMSSAELAGNVQGNMAQIADKGLITAELVKAAMLSSADETNAKFSDLPVTFGQIWTSFQNYALWAFQPVLGRISELANSEIFQGFVNGAMGGIAAVGEMTARVFGWMAGIAGFVVENWGLIGPAIGAVMAAYIIYNGVLMAQNAIQAVTGALSAVSAAREAFRTGVTAAGTTATLAATAAQTGFNAALLACPITWIVLAVLGLIAAVIALANHFSGAGHIAQSAFGAITGGVNVCIQFFKNLGLTAANIALGIAAAVAALGHNIRAAFHNALTFVQAGWYRMLSTVLTVIETICKELNNLPFVSIDYSGISDAAGKYADKAAQAENNKMSFQDVSAAFDAGMETFGTFEDGWVADAYRSGAAWGDGVADKADGFLSGLFGTANIPQADDYVWNGESSGYTPVGDGGGYVADIAGDTGTIADSVETSEEELKYLRDIAEQEAINRYTTSEIRIEQTNYNNISSTMDLDGIVSGLDYAVGEAIDNMTEGVHAG